ncbi:hypothetical protein [Candidatus Clostridium radicumherbarum]|uniref:Uncharacterized protein n=1 Tax=Candidatus Clostridium radicumherbarum TaxID=3381662 RepID=A0ABW8TU22_9CLOT
MKIALWYISVFVALVLFLLSLVYKNFYLAIIAFAVALFLERYTKKIPPPKAFDKFKSTNFKKKK